MGFHHFFCCGQMISGEGSSLEDEFPGIRNVTRYTYRELKRATEDFSHLNKIGEGGFGSVFKGQLRDGTVVAVKELSPESSQGWREFLSELSTLANVRHENLVQIYGFCSEKNHRILVYNYLPNRSLAQTLLGGGYCDLNFDWRTRAKIGVGIAKGLAYLHEEVQPRIVHRDIKASNILLDDDLSPKISDFGLAKLLPSNASHVSTRVAGTIGYLAPEYAIRGQLTRKADIYSFGVLLLEIISGRCNTNTRLPPEDQFLLSRTWEMYEKGDLVSVVDCELNGDFDREEAMRFLKVALLCTQDNPRLRPAMPVVAQILAGERSIKVETITKPGLISEFVDMKIRKEKKEQNGGYSADTISSGASPQDRSLLSAESTVPSFSFTAICDRED